MSRLVIKDKKRFCISISVIFIVILCIILAVTHDEKVINPALDSKYSRNVDRYSEKLKAEYSKPEMKEKFNNMYKDLQQKSVDYAFSHLTEDEKSFDLLVVQVNEMLKNKDYSKLNITMDNPDFWVGDFKLDKTGKLTFIFSSAGIKPDWANDVEFKNIIL